MKIFYQMGALFFIIHCAIVMCGSNKKEAWFKKHKLTCAFCSRRMELTFKSPMKRLHSMIYELDLISNTKCKLDERFLSFSIDALEMMRRFKCFPMDSPKINNLARGLSPAYLRMGGSPQDFETFVQKNNDEVNDFKKTQSCKPQFQSWRTLKHFELNARYFDDIAKFSKRNNLQLIFGLNALNRKADGSWDPENAVETMEYMRKKNHEVIWTLGNEPSRFKKYQKKDGLHYNISGRQLAKDFQKLRTMIEHKLNGPDISRPKLESLKFLKEFLLNDPQLDAVTYHHYNMHESEATVEKFLNPKYLEKFREEFSWIRSLMELSNTSADLWLGETGSASGGGAENLSNTYAAGFQYLGKLGLASVECHKVVIRQSFYGGNYGMLDAITHDPLPDYWVTYIFKKLVGKRTLSYQLFNGNFLQTYTYCDRRSPKNIVVVVVNFDMINSASLKVKGFEKNPIENYILTTGDDNVQSKKIYLNGRWLKLKENEKLSEIFGTLSTQPVVFPPKSYGFFVVLNANKKECY